MKLHELQERRAEVVSEMRSINETAERETRDYKPDEDKRHGELKAELASLDKKIQRASDLQAAERAAPAILHSGRGDGRFEERARGFSIVKAINARLGEPVDDGFEREMSAEVRRRSGRGFQGIAVPDQVFHGEQRTQLTTGSATHLVPPVHRQDLFIDKLRDALVVGRAGATVISDLAGSPIDIPKQTGSSSAQWIAEDAALTATDAAFASVTLTPKTVGALTSYSRRTLLNTSPTIETIIRNDLAAVVANAIDYQALFGTGTGNTPIGVINAGARNLPFTTPGTATWAEILGFVTAAAEVNADIGSAAWITTAFVTKKLRSTLKVAATAAGWLMESPNDIAGYPALLTNAADFESSPQTGLLLFGYWSQLLVGYWTGLDLLINPYESTAYTKGNVLVRVMRDCDVAVRYPESFSYSNNLAV